MAEEIIVLDSSILIDYYRKKHKENSLFIQLSRQDISFAVSAMTHFEIYIGAPRFALSFWQGIFKKLTIIPFSTEVSATAVEIRMDLKRRNKLIELPDLIIAATAIHYNYPLATLNKKHFERVEGLQLL